MSDYGGYAPRRPHALGAWSSVHEAGAASAGDAAPRVALKIFHPPPSTDVRRLYAVEGWLLAAEKQQRAAKSGGAAVEVLACGRCAEGAFAVYAWQDRSLEPGLTLWSAKGDVLRAVAAALLHALEVWETAYGAPHGNLRATNVFFPAGAALAAAGARLSDPWSRPGAKPDELRARDLAAVGALLAEIVRRRAPGGWPIEDSPEWRRLGRAGTAWREYCNFLLDPHAPAETRTPAEARRRLDRIPRDAKPARTAALGAAAAVTLAAGGVVGFARFGDPAGMPRNLRRLAETVGNPRAFRTEIVPEWALLCRAWSTWLGDLERNAGRWQRTDALWSPDDPLRAALAKFSAAATESRPGVIVPEAASETRLVALGDTPPPDVRSELLRGTVAERVTEVWAEIDALARGMETWPRWGELRELERQLQARGFARTAAALRQRVPVPPAEAPTRPDPAALLKTINDVSLDDTGSLLLVQRWGEIARVSADMATSGDRVQAALPALALAGLRDLPSLGDFVDSLAPPLDELQRRRGQFLDPAVVRDRFLKESATQVASGAVTADDVAAWEAQLALFTLVPAAEDPRRQVNFDDRFESLVAAGADLEAEAPAGDTGGLAALGRADFDRELAAARGRLAELRARPVVRRDVAALRDDVAAFGDGLAQLDRRIDATLALLRPDRWLQKVAAQAWPFPAVQARWDAWRQAALAGVAPAQLTGDRERFRRLRQQERQLRTFLDELLGAEGFGALAVPTLETTAPATVAALRELEAARRGAAVATALGGVEWSGGLPGATWTAVENRGRTALEAHRRWIADLPGAAAELERLDGLLRDGFGWTEGVEETLGGFARRGGFDGLGGAPAQTLALARRLETLAASTDRTALVGAAQAEGLSVPLTAWRRLGALDGWPADAAELDVDGGLVTTLRERIGAGVADAARRTALTEELGRATRQRWNRAARNAARAAAALGEVFSRMERYGIAEADLEPAVAYNLALWRFKTADPKGVLPARWKDRRDAFVARVRALDGVAARADVRGFLDQLGALPLAVDESVKATATPGSSGWIEEPVGDTDILARAPVGGVTLTYRLVTPTDGTAAFFLATRAVSVGDFITLMNGAGDRSQEVLENLPDWAKRQTSNRPWNRLIGWRLGDDGWDLEVSARWFPDLDSQMDPLLSPPAAGESRDPALAAAVADRPDRRTPLQQIPPKAAKAFAEQLLGARLMSPAEWRALMALGVKVPEKANLRDEPFQRLWDYLAQYRVQEVGVSWRPNDGIFRPRVAGEGGGPRRPMPDDGRAVGASDGVLWFTPVDAGPDEAGFVHLFGNVWTFLHDPGTNQFHVAGGSALSPAALDPRQVWRVEAGGLIGGKESDGFSDVGVRPAFDAPPGLRARLELLRLVRVQPFLTL